MRELSLSFHELDLSGGLVFKAHRRGHHSTLGWRVIKKKKRTFQNSWVGLQQEHTEGYAFSDLFHHAGKYEP